MSAQRREEFEAAYRELYEPICGYTLRRVRQPEDAAEAIAETFATLWRRFDSSPQGDELRPWLFGVARRVIANQRRGERRRSALGERLVANLDQAAFETTVAPEDTSALARAFASLSESDRELLSLEAWEALTRDEIAVALGTNRAVVRLRLHRARNRLRDALAPTQFRLTGGAEHEWR
ncbi:MAG TPA: sigma-70 family RNA polymerase sigma factor [Gaiellaceae bacterium]|nr:sigma-70 family RNA polymerase sigma factor [Gaiellaceae bacterium]